jgi:hypothetical protein
MSSRRARPPRDHVVAGHWPHAELDGDHAKVIAQELSARLETLLAEQGISLSTISRTAGINR